MSWQPRWRACSVSTEIEKLPTLDEELRNRLIRLARLKILRQAARRLLRTTGREKGVVQRYDVLGHYAQLAAEGRFSIPVAREFSLGDWRAAADLSMSKQAHGKLVLLPDGTTPANPPVFPAA